MVVLWRKYLRRGVVCEGNFVALLPSSGQYIYSAFFPFAIYKGGK